MKSIFGILVVRIWDDYCPFHLMCLKWMTQAKKLAEGTIFYFICAYVIGREANIDENNKPIFS